MKDFTVATYEKLLDALIQAGYQSQTFCDFTQNPHAKAVILRHDVDRFPVNSLVFARLEAKLGLQASYYFRVVPQSLHPGIILSIARLGHEIGYHYEDMDLAGGREVDAITMFTQNLQKLRKLARIDTICMHGSPLSKYDNRDLWKQFDYHDYSIIGEPYFDLDYDKVFYITDTGRRWNNTDASIRDKVESAFQIRIADTHHLIELIKAGELPNQIMINTHPQRWNDAWLPWVVELVVQSLKNQIKKIISRR